nr:hypothetical protein [Arthrobacter nitrophenolicus]
MSEPIVILTEEPLGADDRVNIERLVDGAETRSLSWYRPTPNGTCWWISSRTFPCWILPRPSGTDGGRT